MALKELYLSSVYIYIYIANYWSTLAMPFFIDMNESYICNTNESMYLLRYYQVLALNNQIPFTLH